MAQNTSALPSYLQAQVPYINDNQNVEYIAITAVCLPAAWIAVGLRLLSRHYSAVRYGSDDWTIVVALILGSAWCIDACVSITLGAGRHLIYVISSEETFAPFAKNGLAELVLFYPVLFLIKLSILLLYRRIFPNRKFNIGLWVVGTSMAIYTVVSTIYPLVVCKPLEKFWDVNGDCAYFQPWVTILGVLSILTDAILLAMPIFMILRLQMDRTTKIQIVGLFLTGGLVTIISIIRVIYTSLIELRDGSWSGSKSDFWSIAEICTAIISACLPTYRPLFDKSKRKNSRQYTSFSKRTTYHKTDSDTMEQPLQQIRVQTSITNTWSSRDESPGPIIPTVVEGTIMNVRPGI